MLSLLGFLVACQESQAQPRSEPRQEPIKASAPDSVSRDFSSFKLPASPASDLIVSKKKKKAKALPQGQFQAKGTIKGEVYVKGYGKLAPLQDALCEKKCKPYDYVYFHFTETPNAEFQSYLKQNEGNSSFVEGGIGLGCVRQGRIHYINDSDETLGATFELSPALSQAILGATPQQPIALKLTRWPYSGGRGAPKCYGPFTQVEAYKG